MTSRDAITVVVRVIAVWLLFRALQVAAQMSALADGSKPPVVVALGLLGFGILLVTSVVLIWVFATRIAGRLLPRDTSTTDLVQMNVQDFKQAAFSIVGLYLVATALPRLGYWAAFVQRSMKVNPDGFNPSIEMYATIVSVVVQLVVGFYLLLGSRGLAAMIRQFRGMPSVQGDKTS